MDFEQMQETLEKERQATEMTHRGGTFSLDPREVKRLLTAYNTAGPRYTSYPTAPVWTSDYTADTHVESLKEANRKNSHAPLSLYVHLPFCESRCLFCGCNVVITRRKEEAEKYLGYLFREMERMAELIDTNRPVVQIHWGGGTPTYLSEDQMVRLFTFMADRFKISPQAEIAIEVDPRVTTPSQLSVLRQLGFNRISLGVQDFDADVQEAIHRIQPLGMTAKMVETCRDLGFEEGLNFDLIYGLPKQTIPGFEKTLTEVIALQPDRIALYSYAHVPWLSPHQAKMPQDALPDTETKFALLQTGLLRLTQAGYRYIGMDHFARPDDSLSKALDSGRLHRNFMGYTVLNAAPQASGDAGQGLIDGDLYGFGVSAISSLQQHFAQNEKTLTAYYAAVDENRLPTMRGYTLNQDDRLRQRVILAILCQGEVRYADFEAAFSIRFTHYFAEALEKLEAMAEDGLVVMDSDGFTVTSLGRLFSRNLAMPFDAYFATMKMEKPTFSKTV
jgi:oxygen-independent coproporphyrinogen-3 oxidase